MDRLKSMNGARKVSGVIHRGFGISACVITTLFCVVGIAFARDSDAPIKSKRGVGYPIIDSGYQGETISGYYSVGWIDNDRAMFISFGLLGQPNRSANKSLYEWDTRSGAIKKYVSLSRRASFCLVSGALLYRYNRGDDSVEVSGRVGSEKEEVFDRSQREERGAWRLNEFTCTKYRAEDVPKVEGYFFSPLRAEHGFLGGRSGLKEKGNTYLRPNLKEYVDLPILERTVPMTYSEMRRTYVLREAPAIDARTADVPLRFWLFEPDSERVQPFLIPPGPWMRGSIAHVLLTKEGVAFTSHATGRPDRDGNLTAGASGLYLIRDQQPTRVVPGDAYDASVSPDGCKVILNMSSRTGAIQWPTIRTANFCAKEH